MRTFCILGILAGVVGTAANIQTQNWTAVVWSLAATFWAANALLERILK